MVNRLGSSKRDVDDDFVFTISDSDQDVPNFDEAEDDSTAAPSNSKDVNGKRKRSEQNIKRSKKRGKVNQDTKDDIRRETTDTANDDGTIDPDFEFEAGGQAGDTIGSWEIGQIDSRQGSDVVDIDEIVRRRKKARERVESDDSQTVSELKDLSKTSDDEYVTDDAFGISAIGYLIEEKEITKENEEDKGMNISQDGDINSNRPEARVEASGNEDEDDDKDDVAAPTPHPDDLIFDVEDSATPEPEESPDKIAQRNAFFAPEEQVAEPNILAKTEASFQRMALSRPILKGIAGIGFTNPTPIQIKTVPVALLGKDVVGGAVTGSGKTAAFIIPILERLLYRPKKVATTRVGILMPTRELAVQCFNVATKLASFTDITFALIVGGLSLREQEQALKKRPDVVIATPGRFIDHMRNTVSFIVENIEILILDEADRMLEDGFADELNEIITTIPRKRQTMLFSATMTEDVDKLIRVGMTQPVRLLVDAKKQTVTGLTQEFIKLKMEKSKPEGRPGEMKEESRRLAYLLHLATHTYTAKTIVFFPTKALAHRVKVLFALNGLHAVELHGSMSQEQRLAAIAAFKDGIATHLLATDLASRGLDIPRVETVINYTVPLQTATYLHRVGRTARAGRTGVACTLFASVKESRNSKSKSISERALLKPIMRVAKGQKALIRTRTLPADIIASLVDNVRRQHDEIDEILREEKEERLIAQTERDVTKSENMIKFGEEIAARPRRTWFQTDKDKAAAKEVGREERVGAEANSSRGSLNKKKLGRLSNKQKKALDARDERTKRSGWEKSKEERFGGGLLKSSPVRSNGKKRKQKHTSNAMIADLAR